MHKRAVLGYKKICAASLNFLDQRQTSAAGTGSTVKHANIARAVPEEGKVFCREMGYYNLSRFLVRNRVASLIDNLDNNILRSYVHAPAWAFMRNKTGVPTPITVGY